MSSDRTGEMQIGKLLKEARGRAGLDMRTVEERTKIRTKYLRALEGEEWDALPSPAYAKGFLRTYAELLGLDGEAVTDAYRRQVERGDSETAYPLGDQVLERRRRPGEQGSSPRLAVVIVLTVVAAVGVLLLIGLTGDDDEGRSTPRAGGSTDGGERDGHGAAAVGTVTLGLSIREPVEICLLGGGGGALIDGQVLAAGTEDSYERRRFELRFPKGFAGDQLRLELDGRRRLLPKADGPASYEIVAPQRVTPGPAPGKDCP